MEERERKRERYMNSSERMRDMNGGGRERTGERYEQEYDWRQKPGAS